VQESLWSVRISCKGQPRTRPPYPQESLLVRAPRLAQAPRGNARPKGAALAALRSLDAEILVGVRAPRVQVCSNLKQNRNNKKGLLSSINLNWNRIHLKKVRSTRKIEDTPPTTISLGAVCIYCSELEAEILVGVRAPRVQVRVRAFTDGLCTKGTRAHT